MKLDEIFEANPNIKGRYYPNSTCYILGNYRKARGTAGCQTGWL